MIIIGRQATQFPSMNRYHMNHYKRECFGTPFSELFDKPACNIGRAEHHWQGIRVRNSK